MLSYIIGNNDYAKKVLPSKTSVTKLKTLFRKHLVYYWCQLYSIDHLEIKRRKGFLLTKSLRKQIKFFERKNQLLKITCKIKILNKNLDFIKKIQRLFDAQRLWKTTCLNCFLSWQFQ